MVTAVEARRGMELLTTRAVRDGIRVLRGTSGTMEQRRAFMLDTTPSIIIRYSEGTAALAADYFVDERSRYVDGAFQATLVIPDRRSDWRRDTAWALEVVDYDLGLSEKRLRDVLQYETAKPYWHTLMGNTVMDETAAAWRRIANPGACNFCRMLADRGLVYKSYSVDFKSHPNCMCGIQPVWTRRGQQGVAGDTRSIPGGYVPSRVTQTDERRRRLRDYLNAVYGD